MGLRRKAARDALYADNEALTAIHGVPCATLGVLIKALAMTCCISRRWRKLQNASRLLNFATAPDQRSHINDFCVSE